MSTVKIKTEPTTATATATAVDVKVKLEPNLSAADIKLEQHTSDIDTKVEPDSDTDNDIKSESDNDSDSDGDTNQSQFTIIPKNQQKWICDNPGCSRRFNSSSHLKMHQHEHKLQTEIKIFGKTYTLTRQSLNDRWTCPILNCTSTYKTVAALGVHIRNSHSAIKRRQPQQLQMPPVQPTRRSLYFLTVDDFCVNGVRCGYHNATGVFICHECRLVPECLLTHLQQKHGYDGKSIDNTCLPDSAINASADPNINQHTSNPHLAAAIRKPHWQQHQDIIRGWLCVTADCSYCSHSVQNQDYHKKRFHYGEQFTTVQALVLRLTLTKKQTSCFLVTRIDQVTARTNGVKRHQLDYSHNGLNIQDEDEDDISQNETTDESNQKRQYFCNYDGCRRLFNSSKLLSSHRREHKREVVINVRGKSFTLARQSSDDRWVCPIPDCEAIHKTIGGTRAHILSTHSIMMKQKRANSEDDDNNQQQRRQPIIKRAKPNTQYLKVDDFYASGTKCSYHIVTGLFICYECRLVPECFLTHLQQKHGYDEKLVNNSTLPDSAVGANVNPNINQHTSNPHLVAAISQPYKQHHQDILQGWLCVASDCGYCGLAASTKNKHKRDIHYGEQMTTVPALVLRLHYAKTQTSSFLITRLDTVADDSIKPSNSMSQHDSECDYDDGEELVLSDYSDEDDIY